MFNVAVINIKDIIKYLAGLIITIIIIMCLTRYFSNINKKNNIKLVLSDQIDQIKQNSMTSSFNNILPGIEETNEELNKIALEGDEDEYNMFAEILNVELGNLEIEEQIKDNKDEIVVAENKDTSQENQVENENTEINILENKNNTNSMNISEIQTGVQTEVVTQNPLKENVTNHYGNVKIKNETKFELTEEMLTPNIEITNKNIMIFHTHTCESYTSCEKYTYTPTGNYRTTDLNFTVSRVGDELTTYLNQFGFNVNHDKTYHDYPAYNGSYTRSLETVQNLLKQTNSDVIIDLHRDAIGSNSNYAPTVKIGEEYGAQLMFVIGTNGGGLWHPNWNQNLKFAVLIQQKANEMYPGLFKPIILRNSRYNQHLGKAACIIEVGATGNTLEQCLVSMKYLAKVIDEVM